MACHFEYAESFKSWFETFNVAKIRQQVIRNVESYKDDCIVLNHYLKVYNYRCVADSNTCTVAIYYSTIQGSNMNVMTGSTFKAIIVNLRAFIPVVHVTRKSPSTVRWEHLVPFPGIVVSLLLPFLPVMSVFTVSIIQSPYSNSEVSNIVFKLWNWNSKFRIPNSKFQKHNSKFSTTSRCSKL